MRNVIRAGMSFIVLMEEILHHQECMKPWKKLDTLSTNWCRISFHQHYHLGNPQADLSWKSKQIWICTLWSYPTCNTLELPRDQVQYLFVPSLHTLNVPIKCDPVNLDDVSIYGSSCFWTGRCKRTSTLQNLRTLPTSSKSFLFHRYHLDSFGLFFVWDSFCQVQQPAPDGLAAELEANGGKSSSAGKLEKLLASKIEWFKHKNSNWFCWQY